jgi:hypothetical protein
MRRPGRQAKASEQGKAGRPGRDGIEQKKGGADRQASTTRLVLKSRIR